MNLFKRALAGALGLTLGVLAASSAQAYENPHKSLVDTLKEAGVTFVSEGPHCEGRYGFFGPVEGVPVIGLCTENIENMEQLYTTTRHEAIHVIQLCKAMGGAPQVVAGFALIKPEVNHYYMDRAQDNGWHILGYEPKDWEIEAEAFVLSNTWTAQQVEAQVKRYCF